MAFIKLQTDAFINPKVRRISDGAFRMWVYLLGQAWVEGPGKPAGVVRVKGVFDETDSGAIKTAARAFGGASGADEGGVYDEPCDRYPGMLNELENVGLVHITAEGVGTAVGTNGIGPSESPDVVWDIEVALHDWAHHNPRKAPSHTTEGEAERKRKYRSQKENTMGANSASGPKRPRLVVPSVPTTDKDLDKDPDQDPDSQPEDVRLADLAAALGRQFGFEKPLGLGIDQDRTRREFARWFQAKGPEATGMECLRLATEKREKPRNLSWFVGWLETVTTADLYGGRQ